MVDRQCAWARVVWTAPVVGVWVLLAWCGIPPGRATAKASAGAVGRTEAGWAEFRGARRDGVSDERNLLASWPEGGPKVLWTVSGLGRGYSSPVVGGGRIYLTGDVREQLRIFALDLDGKEKWRALNGASWKKPFGGARGSCSYRDGRLVHVNAHGRVVCLDAATGSETWAVDMLRRFAAKRPPFGIAECVLVDGSRVLVTPAGRKGLLAALDLATGKTLWASDVVAEGAETAGYSSPILIERAGTRQVIATTSHRTVGVDVRTGKLLWSFALKFVKQSCSTIPVFGGDSLFITNTSRHDGMLYRLRIDEANARARKGWSIQLANTHGSMVYAAGRIFGASSMKLKGWASIDPSTGKVLALRKDLAIGSAVYADGRLYCLTERGTMVLLKPGENALETVGQFEFVQRKKDVWPHPVVCGGRLYLRYHDKLTCYDIRR